MSEPYTIGKLTRTRKDGSTYWHYCIVWREPDGSRKRYSLGTTDKVEAEAQARKVWATMNTKALSLETVGNIVATYLDTSDAAKKATKRKREAWEAAKGYWAGLSPDVIDDEVSLAYLDWRKRSAHTMRHELGLVRSALTWARNEGHLAKAPKIILPAMPEATVDHLTKVQFRKFLKACVTPHIKLFAMLAVTTGGRKTAILEAKWDQVDFERRLIDLNARARTQTGKYRAAVPLNDLIMPALRKAVEVRTTDYIIEHHGKPCLDIKRGFSAAAARSGIKAHPHMLRHSAAVWMAEDRVPMSEIAAFLGHRNINITTRVYARYNPEHLRGAASSLWTCNGFAPVT